MFKRAVSFGLILLSFTVAARAADPSEEAQRLWWRKPLVRPAAPAVKDAGWVRNPIDSFVLAKLEVAGLHPAPTADKLTLIRRATFDLTGLPPTLAEVDAFVADQSPDAYEKLIDRLLASPHYGEKWGRHWLDLVRYAESNSYERDNPKPNVWRYRDYVIQAFNNDKPYDQFIREQLAGDEIAGASDETRIATGFYRLGIWDDEPSDPEQARYDVLDDIVSTTGTVFLGLTVGCARCHDHKIDPFPQKDYYSLVAFFQNVTSFHNGGPTDEFPLLGNDQDRTAYEQRMQQRDQRRKELTANIKQIEADFRQILSGEPAGPVSEEDAVKRIAREGSRVLGAERFGQYRQYKQELAALQRPEAGQAMALCVSESGRRAPQTFVLMRGNAHVQGDPVEPAFPSICGGGAASIPQQAANAKTTGRRTVLANWIGSKENPLTARVIANRIWQYHFGRGIVRSASDFGMHADQPTHPQLLDWLAGELIANGWHFKALHKLIMTSDAYRMSSKPDAKELAADSQNDLLWRFDMRRLTAEEVRDSILAANGSLNLKMLGPSIYPIVPKEVLAGQSRPGNGWGSSTLAEAARRSIYIHVKRSLRLPVLENFDAAETDVSCPVRFTTVQPTQALGLLNSDFINQEAVKLAARLKKEAGDETKDEVALALRLATGRSPVDAEIRRGVELIESLKTTDGASAEIALKDFCLVVLNLNEFVYLD
ncbi:MAG TPA: DUF1549 and DUF1553 domain-containing protein [Humisphaera sp.]|nr:DUF1549 and DUF1553 domain-containing protein [Humisphaera sp.]